MMAMSSYRVTKTTLRLGPCRPFVVEVMGGSLCSRS
jgi:hypothetical protein